MDVTAIRDNMINALSKKLGVKVALYDENGMNLTPNGEVLLDLLIVDRCKERLSVRCHGATSNR